MLGLKRRKKVEGWAIDVVEHGTEEQASNFYERLARNNRLWFLSLLVLIAACLMLMQQAKNAGGDSEKFVTMPKAAPEGSYVDEKHEAFAREFAASNSGNVVLLEARFVNPNRFKITVPADVGRDDIDLISKLAGMKILRTLHHRSVVEVYTRRAGGGEKLVAITRWEPKQYGFVVTRKGEN